MIEVRKIVSEEELAAAFRVRRIVYIDEQQVLEADEFDAFENESVHYLGLWNDTPCGAARWRKTTGGIKLERFAVLPEFRGKGIGYALVEKVLEDVLALPDTKRIYLNAQADVVGLYAKFGFRPVGDIFIECDIKHQQMERLK